MTATELTVDEKTAKIATACGWTKSAPGWWSHPTLTDNGGAEPWPPQYFEDLNATHEAEKVLQGGAWVDYVERLKIVVGREREYRFYIHANAEQRAEAFGRTLGLW